jgi:hypothetical protein
MPVEDAEELARELGEFGYREITVRTPGACSIK